MPLGRFLHHLLVIERPAAGAVDDRGVPAQTWGILDVVMGLVQPKSVRELAQLSQGGPVTSDLTITLYPTDLHESDRITSSSGTYQIDGIRDAGGAGHHLAVDAHKVAG